MKPFLFVGLYLFASLAVYADAFSDYWFGGKAEVSTYALKQVRYGQVNEGEAVLIFVTEPFSKSKQVKLDNYKAAGADKIDVFKMNKTRSFFTGVYPYSVMLSTFTPVDRSSFSKLLKATHSVQEWCGHTYMQVNTKGSSRFGKLDSYFEGESNQSIRLGKFLLEDELWSVLRLNPEKLPQGDVKLIPAFTQLRFRHIKARQYSAKAKLMNNGELSVYSVDYPKLKRTLEITYKSKFPHEIQSWSEMDNGLKTSAVLKTKKHFPYWQHNKNADAKMRGELQMGF